MNQPQAFCQSCGAPVATGEKTKSVAQQYCEYCTDETGKLKPREAVRDGIAGWLASWANEKGADFTARADHYMSAMPAWAKD